MKFTKKQTGLIEAAKNNLQEVAKMAKNRFFDGEKLTDLPAIRQAINDHCDSLLREILHPSNGFKDGQHWDVEDILSEYAASLHPLNVYDLSNKV